MRKALITGITGQDGSYLSELLLEKGYEVGKVECFRRKKLLCFCNSKKSPAKNVSSIKNLYYRIYIYIYISGRFFARETGGGGREKERVKREREERRGWGARRASFLFRLFSQVNGKKLFFVPLLFPSILLAASTHAKIGEILRKIYA